MHETPVIRFEEKLAMQTAESSVRYENQMYRIGVPWKEKQSVLPDNYDTALKRLENTEKRLKRSPDIADSYSKCIEQYVSLNIFIHLVISIYIHTIHKVYNNKDRNESVALIEFRSFLVHG